MPPDQKWCRGCNTVKSVDEFSLHRGTRDGRQTYCRSCFARRYRAQREADGHLTRPIDIPDGFKFCRGCEQVLPLDAWAARAATKDGLNTRCRACTTARDRNRALKTKYGISAAEVDTLIDRQGGVCSICLTAPAVHVDHDHATGTVRGMLCFSCNAALGHFRDDPAVLRRAAEYLEESRHSTTTSARDEAAWAAVLTQVPASGPSRLEQAFRQRLADATGGPTS